MKHPDACINGRNREYKWIFDKRIRKSSICFSSVLSFVYPFNNTFVYPFNNTFVYPFNNTFVYPFNNTFVYPFVYLIVYIH